MNRLQELCALPVVSGDEKEIRDYLYNFYIDKDLEIIEDRLGSVFGVKNGNSNYNVMISSNMDESGLMISKINDNGTMEFIVVGLYMKAWLNNQYVTLLDRHHKKLSGIVLRKDDDFVIDAGFKTKEEAEGAGVLVGNFVIVTPRFELLNQNVAANNLSNRAGIEVGLKLLESLENKNLNFNLNVGGISHSVVGQRGAITATTSVHPDLAIVVDAAYVESWDDKDIFIRSFDKSLLPSQILKQDLYEAAKACGFMPQAHLTDLPTDGSFIHKSLSGTPTVVVVIPLKYKDSIYNVIDTQYLDNITTVLNHYLTTLNSKRIVETQNCRGTRHE
ncbi:hypothetical protein PT169_03290 [Erysipelothrix rhusiopathiae]|nr:hypothetical protein [Erysipelothrix rhusiopathiae]